jgi:fumarate hydratase subunit beta
MLFLMAGLVTAARAEAAGRMDAFTPMLIERGLRGMIGRGRRSEEVRKAAMQYGCVYFGAVEGTAALLSGRCR